MGTKFKKGQTVEQILPSPQKGVVKKMSMDDDGVVTVFFDVEQITPDGTVETIETNFTEDELKLSEG